MLGGGGFKEGATVSIKWDDKEIATTKAGAQGVFVATFKVPASKAGNHTVVVTDGTATKNLTFSVETTVPQTPAPLAPAMGAKVQKALAFDWKDITVDNPPTTYTLQVATSSDFSASSIVLERKGLTASTYTATAEELTKLQGRQTAYYWRVQAVDASETASPWTGAGQFYVSKPFALPTWANWAAIVVGGLILALLGYWLGRRSAYSG